MSELTSISWLAYSPAFAGFRLNSVIISPLPSGFATWNGVQVRQRQQRVALRFLIVEVTVEVAGEHRDARQQLVLHAAGVSRGCTHATDPGAGARPVETPKFALPLAPISLSCGDVVAVQIAPVARIG